MKMNGKGYYWPLMLLGIVSISLKLNNCEAFSANSNVKKVTVVGGSGFVGSRVCKILTDKYGVDVTSVSKSGKAPDWCKGEDWSSLVEWKAADLLSASEDALDASIGKPDAIVSCVGVVGTDPEVLLKGNGQANVAAFASAHRGGNVERASLVSVASEVAACQESWLPEFFGGYFDGKEQAEKAALAAVKGDSSRLTIVKPTFIYGGDSFGLLPPRVNYAYGSAVEEVLSWDVCKFLANITPGLIKVALRPPVSVDAVAGACAAAIMEDLAENVLDGTEPIKAATNDPPATGFSEAVEWAKENSIKAYDWAKVEVPKAIDTIKTKLDEVQK